MNKIIMSLISAFLLTTCGGSGGSDNVASEIAGMWEVEYVVDDQQGNSGKYNGKGGLLILPNGFFVFANDDCGPSSGYITPHEDNKLLSAAFI